VTPGACAVSPEVRLPSALNAVGTAHECSDTSDEGDRSASSISGSLPLASLTSGRAAHRKYAHGHDVRPAVARVTAAAIAKQ